MLPELSRRDKDKMGKVMERKRNLNHTLKIWAEHDTGGDIVHIRGVVDLISAPKLRKLLNKIIGGPHPIVVDSRGLDYLDLHGVRVLQKCHRNAQQHGQRLVFVGSTSYVHKLLTLLKLDQPFLSSTLLERICGPFSRPKDYASEASP
jgi:anti-anti-sigma factor